MKKIATLFGLMGLLCTQQSIQAQKTLDANHVKQLVSKNASDIGLTVADVENSRVVNAYYDAHAQAFMVYLQQTYKGTDVYNAIHSLAFKNDKLVSSQGSSIGIDEKKMNASGAVAAITAADAVRAAAKELNLSLAQPVIALKNENNGKSIEFGNLGVSYNNITANLFWIPSENHLQLSWEVSIYTAKSNAAWYIKVDAITGKVLSKQDMTVNCNWSEPAQRKHNMYVFEDNSAPAITGEYSPESITSAKYNVLPYPTESPLAGPTSLETDPWAKNGNQNANTNKWNTDATTDYIVTRGNNAFAQTDLDSNNATAGYAAASTTALPNLTFNYPIDTLSDPLENPSFAVTNLFYWNNTMHDLLYQYGFDEIGGNYQSTNFGRGGLQNDIVYADAQDGGGAGTHIDNANFAPAPDGQSGRMQMYIWRPSSLKTFKINSPANLAGVKPAAESNVSINNKLAQTGTITNDIIVWKDAAHPDSSTACSGAAANAAQIAGHIAYIDRGSCNFTVKFHSAQSLGARAILVGNVALDDPRYNTEPQETGGNFLVIMSGDDNTITIPGVFIQYDSAQKIKNAQLSGQTVNGTESPSPRIDGDLDAGVITHEHTHGMSNRLVGGVNTVSCLQSLQFQLFTATPKDAEVMDEGWSDYLALMMTTNWATAKATDGALPRPIGNYVIGYPTDGPGIRAYPYSTNMNIDKWTYDSLRTDPTIPELKSDNLLTATVDESDSYTKYYVGEIWCTTLWEMTWNLIQTNGINKTFFDASKQGGNTIAMNLVIEAQKLTPCEPQLTEARDAILQADTILYSGSHAREIWTAFAGRGLGVDANFYDRKKLKDGIGSYKLPKALPVTWGSFTAEKNGNTALLKWTTLQEVNTDKFIVERSADGRVYTSIATVKAAGNSSVEKSYSSPDAHPLKGNNNYRIKQVDKDGKANYSDVRYLNFADIKPYIKISPNPATDIVTINIAGNTQSLNIQLMSSPGQFINKYIMSGENYSFDVSKLAAGVYNIIIDGDGYSAKYKLVIQ